jgi:ribosomal protein S18 acetylase RimI-like enzyme
MNEIINNLFSLYRETGTLSSVSFLKMPGCSMVAGERDTWPQMVFDVDLPANPAQKLALALQQAVDRKFSGFAVCDARLFKSNDLDILRDKGIFPVKSWTLMEATPEAKKNDDLPTGFEIKKMSTPGQLLSFGALVNSGLMQSVKMDPCLMVQMHEKPAFHSYGLFSGSEPVSGLLTYSDPQSTGLYFIVTRSDYRGKGLAEKLIQHVLHMLFLQKTGKVVLQAVQKAVPLYARLGFASQGKLIIFWKR